MTPAVYRLSGKVQHYNWGGKRYIPNLLGIENNSGRPFAELWMGTHQKGPSNLHINDKVIDLGEYIQDHTNTLGAKVATKFNNKLPFLFKILDVHQMLSIQAHPTKAQAEEGFVRENQMGIPITASNRNYRDDNHKPEVMVALTDFWLLHGFKSRQAIGETLNTIKAFEPLRPHFESHSIYELYKKVMEMSQEEVDAILLPMKDNLIKSYGDGKFQKSQPSYWAAKAFEEDVLGNGHADRGIFSIYFFNLVNLKPNQGIFQGAGIPHAYLEGVNVELMANSDNVFRGGLTYKHIDVPELLKSLVFESVTPKVLEGIQVSDTETRFPTPAPDFELSKIDISEQQIHLEKAQTIQIGMVLSGTVTINDEIYEKGSSFFVPANTYYQIKGHHSENVIFKAYVP